MKRIILFTGKGGVGKTSVSAATALKCAELGQKTLVISLDMAHSLGDCFDIELGPEPKKISDNLWAQEAEIQNQIIKEWEITTNWFKEIFKNANIDENIADEVCDFLILPGVGTALCLSKIKGYFEKNKFDTIIIDCPPTGETIRLLSASNSMKWYMDNFYNTDRRIMSTVGFALKTVAGIPYPDKIVVDVMKKMYDMVSDVEKLLLDKNICSVRLVMNPEKMVVDESKRAFTYINLFDYNMDGVVINKNIPDSLNDPFFKKWKNIQSNELEEAKKVFNPIPLMLVDLFDEQISGSKMIKKLGDEIYKDKNPSEIFYNGSPYKITKKGNNKVISIYLPNAKKEHINVDANKEECIIKVKDYERKIMLPNSMIGQQPASAKMVGDNLEIVFKKGRAKSEQ